jgi:hypothetical protein
MGCCGLICCFLVLGIEPHFLGKPPPPEPPPRSWTVCFVLTILVDVWWYLTKVLIHVSLMMCSTFPCPYWLFLYLLTKMDEVQVILSLVICAFDVECEMLPDIKSWNCSYYLVRVLFFFFFFLVGLESELRASQLQSRGSTTWAHLQSTLFWLFWTWGLTDWIVEPAGFKPRSQSPK